MFDADRQGGPAADETSALDKDASKMDTKSRGSVDTQTLAALEFPRLLESVAQLTQSRIGAQMVHRLYPSSDSAKVERRLRRLSQLREILEFASPPGLENIDEVSELLPRLEVEGAVLLPQELFVVADFLSSVSRADSFLTPSENGMDEAFRLKNRLTPLPKLGGRLRGLVGPGNSIKSSASTELQRVRRELSRKRDNLRAKLEKFITQGHMGGVFSDQVVTQRADRFVVPVRSDSKGKVQGILHDTSGSGATCFMEPLDAVEDNNQLAMLRNKEREEELRVLREVARELALNLQVLYEDLETLAKLDCLLAQARFAQRLDAVEPRLSNSYEMELNQARHPLLAWRALSRKNQVVPIDLSLGKGRDVLMISGANAGGKTVTLKTVGLITLMVMCGMHVPCQKGSLVSVFQQVAAEVGDEQDLNEALSTFTAHAGRLAWMTRNATRQSLFLIDEIGGGTDPGEGAALAMAVIDRLKRLGAKVLTTTHFHRLKAFAALTPGIENVSVTFDSGSGKATYRLHYGAPGLSDALAVSAGLGFPESVLHRANSYMDESEKQTIALLRQAQNDRRLAREELAKARAGTLAAAEDKQKARELLKAAKKERQGALAEGKRRVREVAHRMEGMLKDLLGEIEEKKKTGEILLPGAEKQKLYKARRDALAKVEEVVSGKSDAASFSTDKKALSGDKGKLVKQARVRVTSLGQAGTLLEDPVPDVQTVLVSVGVRGVRVRVSVADLEPLGNNSDKADNKSAPKRVSVRADAGDGLDLKVIGCTVDEAIPLVDKALDQALLAGRARLRVVHGMGTGRLKTAVRRYLSDHPCVLSTKNAPINLGGGGVTVAELRE